MANEQDTSKMTVPELREYAKSKEIDLGDVTLKADILNVIDTAEGRDAAKADIYNVIVKAEGNAPESVAGFLGLTRADPVDGTPKIVPSKHAAMCGQATADNHEERIRDLEEAVAYLLAQ